jgi:hypothetical protein
MQILGRRPATLYIPLAVVLSLVTGCTTTTIRPIMAEKPAQTYSVVALGDIAVPDETAKLYVAFFRRGFSSQLKTLKGIDAVLDPAPGELPPTAILVSGQIVKVDRGNAALRWIIGFGAGRERTSGRFEIHDAQGRIVAQFDGAKAYSGGLGIGGANLVDMEDLMEKFGVETANAVWHWSNGQSLIEDVSSGDPRRPPGPPIVQSPWKS